MAGHRTMVARSGHRHNLPEARGQRGTWPRVAGMRRTTWIEVEQG
ncbi:hypothetical protein YT1_1183 [Rhodococcus ruber]|nr:hypothetical protein YT1_1183 [Rhodococcus ruber]